MNLSEGEEILKVYHHHSTPFIYNVLKVIIGTFPFFLLLFLFKGVFSERVYIILHIIVFVLFALLIVYISLIYWLDKLIVTNKKIIHVNWKYLTVCEEVEALLQDIQEVQTEEKGILSTFKFFDYGVFRVATASSKVTIEFLDAPNPEGIRLYVYHIIPQ